MHLIPSLKGGGRTETRTKETTERISDPFQQENYKNNKIK
jgi:hypothetical protein